MGYQSHSNNNRLLIESNKDFSASEAVLLFMCGARSPYRAGNFCH